MNESHDASGPEPKVPTPRADGFLFWILAFLAFAAFAPCVLVPEWRQLQALNHAEQIEQNRVDNVQAAVNRERKLMDAMRSDPGVITRLAQRDLSLSRRDERAILVSIPEPPSRTEPRFVPRPLPPPAIVAGMLRYLPEYDYAGLFCDARSRLPIMALSASLLAVAFALFGRRPA